MTIEEYHKIRVALHNASESEKEFFKNICKAAGHEWFKDPNEFADVCTRCEEKQSWINGQGISRVAAAMVAPLKATLDYSSIARKLVDVDKIDLGPNELPIYDKDIPEQ
jgi:hypothetical protein